MKETRNGERPRNLQWWEPVPLLRAHWTRRGHGAQTNLEQGRERQMEGQTCRQTQSTEIKREVREKYPHPSFQPSSLLPGPPPAKPNGKAVDGAVSREQHPRPEQSTKDGEWRGADEWRTASKPSNPIFLIPP